MRIEISIANADAAGRNYLTWAPVRARIRLFDAPPNGGEPVAVTVRNQNPQAGGQLAFSLSRGDPRTPVLDLKLPTDSSPVDFFVAGVVGRSSREDGDAVLSVSRAGATQALGSKRVMVRIRKNANTLTPAERDRFTTALAKLNNQGAGQFQSFREMHRQRVALRQAHGAPGFLAWHRAYLLDLERELQRIDPSVALPYWRFDQPAPNLFTPEFLGRSSTLGTATFAPTNLLAQWRTDGAPGITRTPFFNAQSQAAFVASQGDTLIMGGPPPTSIFDTGPTQPGGFDEMEGDPHGNAHTSFDGWIQDPATAPRDPLFFLLHCNVDRLWAGWQFLNGRFDGTRPDTYFFRGTAGQPGSALIGHNLLDSMWPWNGDTAPPRPPTAPRGPFPVVPTAAAPGPAPTVRDMIDYAGFLNPAADLNFAYDGIPFGVAP
ncbi:tyrosinase family protein [Geodermatophilus sp. URMC 64]